jgi:hypothetical protein
MMGWVVLLQQLQVVGGLMPLLLPRLLLCLALLL